MPAAIDDEGGRQGDESALIAVALGEIDAVAGEHLAIGGGGAEEHAEQQAHRAVDIGQDLIAEPLDPLGIGEMVAGIGGERHELAAGGLDLRQGGLQRLQRLAAIGAPIAAEEIDDQGAAGQELVGGDEPALGIGQEEGGHGIAGLQRPLAGLGPVEAREEVLIGGLELIIVLGDRADLAQFVFKGHSLFRSPRLEKDRSQLRPEANTV